jgi:hypothetical protein
LKDLLLLARAGISRRSTSLAVCRRDGWRNSCRAATGAGRWILTTTRRSTSEFAGGHHRLGGVIPVGHGWQRGEPVMLPVAKPSAEIIATFDGGLAPRKPLKDYLAAGVRITAKDSDVTLPADDAQVGLISLDRADGSDEYWLVFENFYVITRYNRSRMYASSVWSLAYALRGVLPSRPRHPERLSRRISRTLLRKPFRLG